MSDTKIYYIGQGRKRKIEEQSEDEKRIYKINRNGVRIARGGNDKRLPLSQMEVRELKQENEDINEKTVNNTTKEEKNSTKRSNIRFYKQPNCSIRNCKTNKSKIRESIKKARKAGTIILFVTAMALADRYHSSREVDKIAVVTEESKVLDKTDKMYETVNEGQFVTIESPERDGTYGVKYIDTKGDESHGKILSKQIEVTDITQKELEKYENCYTVKKDSTPLLDKKLGEIGKYLNKKEIILGKNKTIEKDEKKYIEVLYITREGIVKGYIEKENLRLSEIQTNNGIKDVSKKGTVEMDSIEIVDDRGKHIDWIAGFDSEIYSTGKRIELGPTNWLEVAYYDQEAGEYKNGYIQEEYIKEKTVSMKVNTNKDNGVNLNIRQDADIDSERIGEIENGSYIDIIEETIEEPIIGIDGKKYYKVLIEEEKHDAIGNVDGVYYREGYVNADYIEEIQNKSIQTENER